MEVVFQALEHKAWVQDRSTGEHRGPDMSREGSRVVRVWPAQAGARPDKMNHTLRLTSPYVSLTSPCLPPDPEQHLPNRGVAAWVNGNTTTLKKDLFYFKK